MKEREREDVWWLGVGVHEESGEKGWVITEAEASTWREKRQRISERYLGEKD